MRVVRSFFILMIGLELGGFFGLQPARAQVDPSSALLLNHGGSSNVDSGLDTGRYTVKPSPRSARKQVPAPSPSTVAPTPSANSVASPNGPSAGASSASSPTANSTSNSTANSTSGTPPQVNSNSEESENGPLPIPSDLAPGSSGRAAPVSAKPDPNSNPAQSENQKSPLPTGSALVPPLSAKAQETQAPTRDTRAPVPVAEQTPVIYGNRRFNIIDLSIAPGYVYDSSQSSFTYRRYYTSSPSVSLDGSVWFNQNFGLNGSYLTTLSGTVTDSVDGTRAVTGDDSWTTFGVRARKYFTPTPQSPVLTFGADYYEYKFTVPDDAQMREKLTTTGLKLSFEGEFPTGASHAWTLGFSLLPKLSHQEERTGIDFQSGGKANANAIGMSIGSRWQFDRTSGIFWKLSYLLEKDAFSGNASTVDPIDGKVPSGVSVNHSFTIIQLGYSWGN